MTLAPTDQPKLAKSGQEYRDLLDSDADWIIRSADDLTQLRESGEDPLAKVPEEDFRAFVDGLKFNRGGVAGGYYKPLMSSLTVTELFKVMERFGMGRGYALETLEARCGPPCEFDFWHFCSSSCG
jgi:hypothetical protein